MGHAQIVPDPSDFSKEEKGCFGLFFTVVTLAALAGVGVSIWAIIHLVNWITSK